MRWRIYRWDDTKRKGILLGACLADSQPEALGKAYQRFGFDWSLMVREPARYLPPSMVALSEDA